MNQIIRYLFLGLLVLLLLCQCERDDRFYRPRVPQKLSALAIIDADDTLRYIRFEKTFQVEYPEDLTDSLRDLSFTLADSKGVIISFQSYSTLKSPYTYIIPDNIEFHSGETYLFRAKERDCPEIFSEIIVPEHPSGLTLISFEKHGITNPVVECSENLPPWGPQMHIFNIQIQKNKNDNPYYAIMIESYGNIPVYGTWRWFHWDFFYTRFSIVESEVPGFISIFPGYNSFITDPCNDYHVTEKAAPAYYVNGSNYAENTFRVILSNKFNNGISVPQTPVTYRIRLLSISKEMYLKMKSLNTYERNLDDPFAEPVYFKGNLEGGYGIFAICRSIEINIDLWSH